MSEVFGLKGSVTIVTDEAVKQLDDIVAKGKTAAKSIERDTDYIQDSFKDGLDIPDDRFKQQTENIVKHTKNMADDVDTHTSGIHGAIQNAFSFSAGQLISDGLKEAWQFLKDFSVDSVNAASSLDEVQNVVDVVFGEDSSKIDIWSTSIKDAFGIGETKAKEFSGTLGAILDSMGLTNDEVLTMSTNLVELVGDMSSFYNLDHDTAFEKIRSGLTGETEPLKQIGINMSEANLEAYALSKGIDKAWESMTQAEQAGLRYNYMLEAMANASGDFSRTSEGWANQVRLLEENLTLVKQRFGNALIDILLPQLQGINKLLEDWLEEDNPITNATESVYKTALDGIEEADKALKDVVALVDVLDSLGDETERTDKEQRIWEATLEDIVKTMPELSKYIDLTNHTLNVSTDELLTNAEAITTWAKAAAEINATNKMRTIWQDAEIAYAETEQQLMFWQAKSKRAGLAYTDAYNQLKNMMPDTSDEYLQDLINKYRAGYDWVLEFDKSKGGAIKAVAELYDAAEEAGERSLELREELADMADDLELAKDTYEEWVEINEEKNKAQEDAMAASNAYKQALTDQQTAMVNISAAVTELKQQYDALKESARSSLDAIVGGFSKVEQLAPASVAEVKEALQSQHTLLVEYRDNLQEASTWGLDADLLAQLSDGSTDSMAILKMLAGNEEYRQEFNTEWLKNQQLADETAELMAQNQAAADEEFQKMKASVDEMVKDFNKREEARQAMLETGNGAIDAMDETIAALQAQAATVQGILASMFGGSISMTFTPTSGTPGQNAKGIGYVPYDNYLTYLHKGESVLSRTEAESWRKSAQDIGGSIDYDRLAAVLAAEMAGLTMQMDGQMIGALVAPTVSRNLEKEAWRGRY